MTLFKDLKTQHKRPDFSGVSADLADVSIEVAMQADHLEAWETDPWVPPALLRVEMLPELVIDPCVGKGHWTRPLTAAGHRVETIDIVDWSRFFDDALRPLHVADWLSIPAGRLQWPNNSCGRDFAVVMNPPFSGDDGLLACHFVDRALELGARKVVCFQRFAWLESSKRKAWWADNPPARIWLCAERATCYRFDVPMECNNSCHLPDAVKKERKAEGQINGCRECLSTTPTAHAVFVWERGHGGAALTLRLEKGYT